MDIKNIEELKHQWSLLVGKLSDSFGEDLDLQGIIFLIGVQELGKGKKKYSKDEKEDLMHIATCRLLSSYGYYELEGADQEGWPHYKLIKKLPPLSLKEQDIFLKQCVIDYFKNTGLFEE
ncbi:MAG TPA: hypothetical protein VJY62_02720 [Bacteroidia bacterium]|nr:hypothetical protein [Bacteroidia bacterium]